MALGYEERARFLADTHLRSGTGLKVAISFPDRHVMSYADNLSCFAASGFEIHELSDNDVGEYCRSVLGRLISDRATRKHGGAAIEVCVDISSFTRSRLASIVTALTEAPGTADLSTCFMYSPAAFDPPEPDSAVITVCGPVTAQFAGWPLDSHRPVAMVLGLGYEPEKAVGVFEYLEPGDCWVFRPRSSDVRYDTAVDRANRQLRLMVPDERVLSYRVDDPLLQFVTLESLTFGLLARWRPVLVPFGPKVFVLSSLLVAASLSPSVAVWRVSSGELEAPTQRRATGALVGLQVSFRSRGHANQGTSGGLNGPAQGSALAGYLGIPG